MDIATRSEKKTRGEETCAQSKETYPALSLSLSLAVQ